MSVFRFGLHIKRQKEKRKFDFRFSFSVLAYILNDKRKNENFREYASFFEWLLDLPEKKLYFYFLANFGHFGVFPRHKPLFTVHKYENVPKDLLESKTVCWFEVFKEGKQDKVSILLFSVLHLGIVNQKY